MFFLRTQSISNFLTLAGWEILHAFSSFVDSFQKKKFHEYHQSGLIAVISKYLDHEKQDDFVKHHNNDHNWTPNTLVYITLTRWRVADSICKQYGPDQAQLWA